MLPIRISTAIFGAVITFCILKYYIKKIRIFYYGSKFDGPIAWPFVGNALEFVGSSSGKIIALSKRYQSNFRFYLGNDLHVYVTQPEDLEIVLNSPYALQKGDVYKFTECTLGQGIMTAPVPKWKTNRKAIFPAFNSHVINKYVEVFIKQAEIFAENLEKQIENDHLDVYPLMQKCTLSANCEANLGVCLNIQNEHCEFSEKLTSLFEILALRVCHIWLHFDSIFKMTSLKQHLTTSCDYVKKFCENVVVRKQIELSKEVQLSENPFIDDNTKKWKPFADHLIKIQPNVDFTDEQIVDEISTLIFASTDSTASTSSFVLLMLALHQNVQSKVYEELMNIFEDSNRSATCDDLNKMKYLDMVIKETLRLFPIAPVIMRKLTKDIKLSSGFVLPKHSSCAAVIIHVHRDPKIFPNPMKFDPDRFLPEEIGKRHPYSYIPFSAGPRNCIGVRYAMLLVKSILSSVLRKYQVFTNYKSVEDIKIKADLLLKTCDGYKVTLKKR